MKLALIGFFSLFLFNSYAQATGVTGMGYTENSALKNAADQCIGFSNLQLVSFKYNGAFFSLNVICKGERNGNDSLRTTVGAAFNFARAVENAKLQCDSEDVTIIGDHTYDNGVVLAFSICN